MDVIRAHIFHNAQIITADGLVKQGARASAAMIYQVLNDMGPRTASAFLVKFLIGRF